MLDKTNWRDSTIVNILQNEVYKGDFVHGKRTSHLTYYENVVEPIVSKELYEHGALDNKNYEDIIDTSKTNNLKENKAIEKEDFER